MAERATQRLSPNVGGKKIATGPVLQATNFRVSVDGDKPLRKVRRLVERGHLVSETAYEVFASAGYGQPAEC